MQKKNTTDLISKHPDLDIAMVSGTNISVISVLEILYGFDFNPRAVTAQFPQLTNEQINACKDWAKSQTAA